MLRKKNKKEVKDREVIPPNLKGGKIPIKKLRTAVLKVKKETDKLENWR